MQSALLSSRTALQASAALSRRAYATATSSGQFSLAEAQGIKVATTEDGSPTAAISVVIKAGSRFESSPGLAHVLKNSLFKVSPFPLPLRVSLR